MIESSQINLPVANEAIIMTNMYDTGNIRGKAFSNNR